MRPDRRSIIAAAVGAVVGILALVVWHERTPHVH